MSKTAATEYVPRTISRHQYGFLKFVNENHITLGYLRHAHANTLGSVLHWGWISARGTTDEAPVNLTAKGLEELQAYTRASMPERSVEADITERCMRLIKHVRRVVPMQKSA